MRRISSVSSPCKWEVMSRESSRGSAEVSRESRILSRKNPEKISALMLSTVMRASVHVHLPGWTKHGVPKLQARCEELHLQPRGTRGESGGQTGHTYDISNKHRLGYSEVQLVQKMIDGVNKLWEEDEKYQKQYFGDFPYIRSQHSLVQKHVTKEKRCCNYQNLIFSDINPLPTAIA